jgi:tRNA U34 5-methylaminomethyl-2-thiouridine-forming methyltransferase MnmC
MSNTKYTLKKVVTNDGTVTFFVEELNEHYHSIHGARKESMHVYIKNGLDYYLKNYPDKTFIKILEVGFGTGLNALLTRVQLYLYRDTKAHYSAIEPYPIALNEIKELDYADLFSNKIKETYLKFHTCDWGEEVFIDNQMKFNKEQICLEDYNTDERYDVIYFDAFAPDKQPELWSKEIFLKLYNLMNEGGILVTYCAKGQVKRILKEVGYKLEELPGPQGKREMTRAIKKPL